MRFISRRNTLIVAGLVLAVAVAGGGVALAVTSSHSGNQVSKVNVFTSDSPSTFTSATFVNVATSFANVGAAGSVVVARFTAESQCSSPTSTGWCSARILIGGVEAAPVTGTDFAFDSTVPGSTSTWESHSIERVRTVSTVNTLTPVVVQVAMVSGTTLRLDDWILSIWVAAP